MNFSTSRAENNPFVAFVTGKSGRVNTKYFRITIYESMRDSATPRKSYIAYRKFNQVLASDAKLPHNMIAMDLLNQNYLWASCLWSAVAGGYVIYGWRQRAAIPFLGGVAMTAASFLISSALLMSLACVALMFAVYWLVKRY